MDILILVLIANMFFLLIGVAWVINKNFDFLDKQIRCIEIKLEYNDKRNRVYSEGVQELLLGIHRKLDELPLQEEEKET